MSGPAMRIVITGSALANEALAQDLAVVGARFKWQASGVRAQTKATRDVDATIVVAVASATGAALGALLSGLLEIAKARKVQQVVFQGKDGRRLEVPAETPLDRIDAYLDRLRDMDADRIEL